MNKHISENEAMVTEAQTMEPPRQPGPYECFKSDLERYFVYMSRRSLGGCVKLWLYTPGLWVLLLFRYGTWFTTMLDRWKIFFPITALYRYLYFLVNMILGIYIPLKTRIGPGLYIGHYGGIWVHPRAVLGRNCNLSHGITIGEGGRKGRYGVPKIGDGVYIASGAILFGPIEIGNNVAVGANSVVNKSFPDDAVVAGAPAQILNMTGAREFVIVPPQDIP